MGSIIQVQQNKTIARTLLAMSRILVANSVRAIGVSAKAYKLADRYEFRGLPISIETKKGQLRKGVGADGKPWSIKMPFDYGYIRGKTEGKDGELLDCFVGPDKDADNVYVIHQHKEDDDEKYDEDKCMLGFASAPEAKAAYQSAYNIDLFMGMHTFNFEDFVEAIYSKTNKGKSLECNVEEWVGFDLDGTLAEYDKFEGNTIIGKPVEKMVDLVKQYLAEGFTVKIFTARIADDPDNEAAQAIENWCQEYIGQMLPITNEKDPGMIKLYDDRAVQVEQNTGEIVSSIGPHPFVGEKESNGDGIGNCEECGKPFKYKAHWRIAAEELEAGGPGSGIYDHKKGLTTTVADRDSWPEHIKKLAIPPAATKVVYDKDPAAKLKAIWYDSKNRDHPIYSEEFKNSQAELKFQRVSALIAERKNIEKQLKAKQTSDDPKEKEHADLVALIAKTGIRPGSEDDTKAEQKAYGATTLEGRHVEIDDKGNVRLHFIGKDGVENNLPVKDKALAEMLKGRKQGDTDQIFPNASRSSVSNFTHSLDGGDFKTKDLRTALGTETASKLVDKLPAPTNEKEYKQAVKQVAVAVAQKLGNTPAVALSSYIAPQCFSKWKEAINAA